MSKTALVYSIILVGGFALGYSNIGQKIDFLYGRAGSKNEVFNGPWYTNLKIASEEQGMMVRAVVARIGLGANTKEEAIYLTAVVDSDGKPLRT